MCRSSPGCDAWAGRCQLADDSRFVPSTWVRDTSGASVSEDCIAGRCPPVPSTLGTHWGASPWWAMQSSHTLDVVSVPGIEPGTFSLQGTNLGRMRVAARRSAYELYGQGWGADALARPPTFHSPPGTDSTLGEALTSSD